MKKYDIIYADPPWQYQNKRTGGNKKTGPVSGASQKYNTMSVNEICLIPVKDISSKNSVLFLWSTVPLIRDAFEVMYSWGYTYKTMITWHKTGGFGMGYWLRGQCEHLLLGVKGHVEPFRLQEPNFLQTKVLKHSQKPEEFRKLIERATSKMESQNKLELFACKNSIGWDVFGNEVEGSIDFSELLKKEKITK